MWRTWAAGIRADAMALASLDIQVTAVELDETTTTCATMNLIPFRNATVVHADAAAVPLEGIDGVWLDPARRTTSSSGTKRLWDPEDFSPPLSFGIMSTMRLLAKLPTIAAYAYKKSVGQPLLYPDNSLGLVENFLRMSFGFPAEPYQVNPKLVHALDQLLILHADHEQNCSTSTVRLVGSSHANLFASISAGHQRAVRPVARRGEPGGAGDARADPPRRRRRRHLRHPA